MQMTHVRWAGPIDGALHIAVLQPKRHLLVLYGVDLARNAGNGAARVAGGGSGGAAAGARPGVGTAAVSPAGRQQSEQQG